MDAPQVTIGKKYSTGPVLTDQRCFLTKVRAIAGNNYLPGNLTLPFFASQTVNPALPGAEGALFQH